MPADIGSLLFPIGLRATGFSPSRPLPKVGVAHVQPAGRFHCSEQGQFAPRFAGNTAEERPSLRRVTSAKDFSATDLSWSGTTRERFNFILPLIAWKKMQGE